MLAQLINKLPTICLLCDSPGLAGKDICSVCFEHLLKNDNGCYQCGIPLPPLIHSHLCERCQSIVSAFKTCHAPFIYQGAIRYLITHLKFHHHYKNARLLGQLFAESLVDRQLPQCIIPVPLHKKRYRQRGFNQSIEIAKTIGRQLQIPIETKLCLRHRNTPHQIGLLSKDRSKNVKNAFSLIKRTHYTHIAILDDVMTTGATLQEIALIFQQTGLINIELWVCARSLTSSPP